MKKLTLTITTILALAIFAVTGCSKDGVDTSKVQAAFQTAPAVDKADVDQAIASAKGGDYPAALAALQKAAANAKLTPEQKSAIEDLVNQVKAKLAATVDKAAADASKQVGELQKSLNK